MSLTPNERERLEALVAAYRKLPRAEPPAAVDAAVLENARAALRTRARPRWPTLLATAATMTLAIGLAWQLREAEDRVEAQRPAAVSPPVAPEAEPSPVLEDAPREAREDRAAPEDAIAPQLRKQEAPAAEAEVAGGLSARTAPAGTTPGRDARSEADAARGRAREAPVESERAAKAAPEPFPEIEQSSQASGPPPAEDEVLLESEPAPPPPAPAPAAAPAAPPAAPPAVAEPQAATRQAYGLESVERKQPATRDAADAHRADRAAVAREPQAWLDEIVRLLRTGRRERAIEELREFRRAWPDAELPRELRDLEP